MLTKLVSNWSKKQDIKATIDKDFDNQVEFCRLMKRRQDQYFPFCSRLSSLARAYSTNMVC